MAIKQISVFLENRQGALEEFTALLGENGIDLIALSIADTTDFGILRAIVNDNDKTMAALRAHGYTANLTDVLAVAVPDTPGGLSGVLRLLRECGISIEYLYSFVRRIDHDAIIIFRVDKPEEAAELLRGKGVRMLEQGEIACEGEG